MSKTITPHTSKQQAVRAVTRLERPEEISHLMWPRVHTVLLAVAACYPKAHPSQITLAARTGIPERSLKRYIALAVKAGLLVVKPNAGAAPRRPVGARTNAYLLVIQRATLARQENTYSVGVPETSSLRTSSSDPLPDPPAAGRYQPPTNSPTVVRMDEWLRDRDGERDLAPSKPSLRPAKRVLRREDVDKIVEAIDTRRRKQKRQPAAPPRWMRLADYFAVCWAQMQQESDRYKNTRGLESYGQAKAYIQKHFKDNEELEVRKMIEEFVIAVRKGHITVKPGQSAWMCFTGAWGRQRHIDTGDIYAQYREK